jgi:hypothetical protein
MSSNDGDSLIRHGEVLTLTWLLESGETKNKEECELDVLSAIRVDWSNHSWPFECLFLLPSCNAGYWNHSFMRVSPFPPSSIRGFHRNEKWDHLRRCVDESFVDDRSDWFFSCFHSIRLDYTGNLHMLQYIHLYPCLSCTHITLTIIIIIINIIIYIYSDLYHHPCLM